MATGQNVYLHDGAIALRSARPEDAQNLYEAVLESAQIVGQWVPRVRGTQSLADVQAHIQRIAAECAAGTSYSFLILDHQRADILGACAVARHRGSELSGDLTYWVRPSRHGEGIAPRATRLLVGWAFEVLGLRRVEFVIARDNAASIQVAEKLGALREGFVRNRLFVHGEPHDAVIYSLHRDDVAAAPFTSGKPSVLSNGRYGTVGSKGQAPYP